MRRDVSVHRLWLPLALVALASSGFVKPAAQVATFSGAQPEVGIRVLRPSTAAAAPNAFSATLGASALKVEVDAISGEPRVITGVALLQAAPLRRQATREDFAAQTATYLAAHGAALGIDAKDLQLNEAATLIDKDVQFLKYRVFRDGLLVQDAGVDFRFKQGQLVQVVNQSYAEAKADQRPLLAGLDRVAETALLASSAEQTGELYRVVPDGKSYQLVRVAQFDVHSQDNRFFKVEVEMATGKIFEIRPTSFYLEGKAQGSVYPRTYYNDLPATNLPYRDLNLTYSGGSVTTDANGKFVNVPASAQPTLNGFTGTRVKVNTQSGSTVVVNGVLSGNLWKVLFQSTATGQAYADKNMAQSMTYYHLNKEINHAKQYISTPWLDSQLTATVNENDTCNAYWDGSTINLFNDGDGCANTALVADVFYHEWGHGLDDNTGGIDDGAFSEGYGDIMSLLLTHDHVLGKGFMTADGAGVRDMADLKVYPADQGEAHDEGQIIGGTFYDLFLGLKEKYGESQAGDILSKFALKMIFTAAKYTDVYAAVNVIDAASPLEVTAQGPNFCVINKAFARHGLATADASCH